MIDVDSIFYQFIIDKLLEIRSDPSILDQIFYGKSIDDINSMKEFITTNDIRNTDGLPIRVVKHHPRDAEDFPCFSIVLESQTESEQTIGSSGPSQAFQISGMDDGWIGSDSDIFINNIPKTVSVPLTLAQLYNSLEVKNGRMSCHMVGQQGTTKGKGVWIDYKNSVLNGGAVALNGFVSIWVWVKSNKIGNWLRFGFGTYAHNEQVFPVVIHYRNVWEAVQVDLSRISSEQLTAIRYMSFFIADDSQPTDIYLSSLVAQMPTLNTYDEVFLDHRYRIEIWTNNADLTLNLYILLLWLILRYRHYLEGTWDLIEMRLEGGDIIPQPEWLPEVVYIRSLSISCKTIEAIPRETDLTALTVTMGKGDFSGPAVPTPKP